MGAALQVAAREANGIIRPTFEIVHRQSVAGRAQFSFDAGVSQTVTIVETSTTFTSATTI